jgi:hypothetical protein
MQEPQERWIAPEFRFEELTSQVFNGNLEVFNQCLEDCEALVLTEVSGTIIHLYRLELMQVG